MSDSNTPQKRPRRVPLWVLLVIIVSALPVVAFPAMLSIIPDSAPDTVSTYLKIYPIYVVAAAFLAWQCYGRRTLMTWIIVALMLMTHAAMWYLITS